MLLALLATVTSVAAAACLWAYADVRTELSTLQEQEGRSHQRYQQEQARVTSLASEVASLRASGREASVRRGELSEQDSEGSAVAPAEPPPVEGVRLREDLAAQTLNVARVTRERDQLMSKIKDLTRKRAKTFAEYAKADGAIVEVEPGGWYVWIGVGSVQGLRARTHFHAYADVDGGGQRVKAVLEARHVLDERTRCAVLADQRVRDPRTGDVQTVPVAAFPLAVGDKIRNPFFDPKKTRGFAFLGQRLESRHRLNDVQQRIVDRGGRIDPQVSLQTDFVVALSDAGEGFEKQIELATALGIVLLREEELLEYLGLDEEGN